MAPKSVTKKAASKSTLESTPAGAAAASSSGGEVRAVRKKKKSLHAAPINWDSNIFSLASNEKIFLTSTAARQAAICASVLHSRVLKRLGAILNSDHRSRDAKFALRKDQTPSRVSSKMMRGAVMLSISHFPAALVQKVEKAMIEAEKRYAESYAGSGSSGTEEKQQQASEEDE